MKKEFRKLLSTAIDNYLNTTNSAEQKFILQKRKVPDNLLVQIKAELAQQKKLKITEVTHRFTEEQTLEDAQEWHDDLPIEIKELHDSIHEDKNAIEKKFKEIPGFIVNFEKMVSPDSEFLKDKWSTRLPASAREVESIIREIKTLREDLAAKVRNKLRQLESHSIYDDNITIWENVWIQMHWAIEIRAADKFIQETQHHLHICETDLEKLNQLQMRHDAKDKDKEALLSDYYKKKLANEVVEIDQVYDFNRNFSDLDLILEKLVERLRIHEKFDPNLSQDLETYDEKTKERKKCEKRKDALFDRVQLLIAGSENKITDKVHRLGLQQLADRIKYTTCYDNDELVDYSKEIDGWEVKQQNIYARISDLNGVRNSIYLAIQNGVARLKERGQEKKAVRLKYLGQQVFAMSINDQTNLASFRMLLGDWKNYVIDSKSNYQVMASGQGFFCKPRPNDVVMLDHYEELMALPVAK